MKPARLYNRVDMRETYTNLTYVFIESAQRIKHTLEVFTNNIFDKSSLQEDVSHDDNLTWMKQSTFNLV